MTKAMLDKIQTEVIECCTDFDTKMKDMETRFRKIKTELEEAKNMLKDLEVRMNKMEVTTNQLVTRTNEMVHLVNGFRAAVDILPALVPAAQGQTVTASRVGLGTGRAAQHLRAC